jgi:hypothetical protein
VGLGAQVDMAFVSHVATLFAVPVRLLMFPAMSGRPRSKHRHRNHGRAS